MSAPATPSRARAATLDHIRREIAPSYLEPVPCADTLRAWFDAAQVPRLKANPHAKRGGGSVFYSVAAVEKLLGRMLGGKLTSPGGSK